MQRCVDVVVGDSWGGRGGLKLWEDRNVVLWTVDQRMAGRERKAPSGLGGANRKYMYGKRRG